MNMFLHHFGKISAPDFPKGLTWLNSPPLSLKKLSGKIVLIDFWAYSCINCLRTWPYLRNWHKVYADKGLIIIGVHTPEFAFEKERANVEKALKKYNLIFPVVLDNDYQIWNAYANRWWPRIFLIDSRGHIVYDHIGEGGYSEIEAAIQKELSTIGAIDLPPIPPDVSLGGGICYRTTSETYMGFLRGKYGNAAGFVPNEESVFTDEGKHEEDLIYLHGHWQIMAEQVRHTKKLPIASEYVAIRYSGFSVNAVMGPRTKKTALVEIELDGAPLPSDMAGDDVIVGSGHALCKVTSHRLYQLINADTYHRGTLKLKTAADNLEIYALNFGGCKEKS